jgi:putative alpha-1,2-mannosidase
VSLTYLREWRIAKNEELLGGKESIGVSSNVFEERLFWNLVPVLNQRPQGNHAHKQFPHPRSLTPMIGASTSTLLGEGKTFPGPTTPFGMVQLSPDTITGGVKDSGYAYEGDNAPGYSFCEVTW